MKEHGLILIWHPLCLFTYLQPSEFLHLPFFLPAQTPCVHVGAIDVGDIEGAPVGIVVGLIVGMVVGERVGMVVGEKVGMVVGERVGMVVGAQVGVLEGESEGLQDGDRVGTVEGAKVGVGVVTVEFWDVTVELRLNSTGIHVSSFMHGGNGKQASSSLK